MLNKKECEKILQVIKEKAMIEDTIIFGADSHDEVSEPLEYYYNGYYTALKFIVDNFSEYIVQMDLITENIKLIAKGE